MDEGKIKELAAMVKANFAPEKYKEALGRIANEVLGPLPLWSDLPYDSIKDVATATAGGYTLAYYKKSPGNIEVLIVTRSEKHEKGSSKNYCGLAGGYVNLGKGKRHGEQPLAAAEREFGEEVIDDKGEAVIKLDSKKMKPLHPYIDYSNPELPVATYGHLYELSNSEYKKLANHCELIKNDAEYKKNIFTESKGEMISMEFMKLSKVLELGKESFFHQHEFAAIEEFAKSLKNKIGIYS